MIVAVVSTCVVGCSKDTNAGTKEVPLKVWVVRAPTEPAGNPGNKGCRLSDQQISERVSLLINHASELYGANIKFTWSGTPTLATDGFLPALPMRTVPLATWITYIPYYHPSVPHSDNWDQNRINIYFVGDVQAQWDPYPQYPALGLTEDPKDLFLAGQPPNDCRGVIVLNDGGFDEPYGFSTRPPAPGLAPITFDQATVTPLNVIEHEMTHYLGRFTSLCFPLNNPDPADCYSATEHSIQENNILKLNIVPVPPLVLPGRWDNTYTERGKVWQRVYNGGWNNL